MTYDEAIHLATLRGGLEGKTYAVATFTRIDGSTFSIPFVDPDTIGPAAANKGIVSVEYVPYADKVTHLPFIQSWEIEYV